MCYGCVWFGPPRGHASRQLTSTRVQLLCGKTLESTRCVANYYIAILIAVLRVLLVIGKCSLISMARFSKRKQKANRQQYYSANRNKVSREMKCYYEHTADVRKEAYASNPEPKRRAVKSRYASNPEPKRQAVQSRYASNPEPKRQAVKSRYASNPEPKRRAVQSRYASNPEPKRQAVKSRYASNPEPRKKAMKSWYACIDTALCAGDFEKLTELCRITEYNVLMKACSIDENCSAAGLVDSEDQPIRLQKPKLPDLESELHINHAELIAELDADDAKFPCCSCEWLFQRKQVTYVYLLGNQYDQQIRNCD